ncbi:hypothetical protein DV092_07910 [Clostridium botulinum]|nr:hypothetical protein [Clostridium botulinum]
MNINMINDLVDWANEKQEKDFKDFILFMNDIDERKLIINTSYFGEHASGKIKRWSILYNRRFPDFDFDIQLDSEEYCTTLSCLTMKNFKKIMNDKYEITDEEGRIFTIQTEGVV